MMKVVEELDLFIDSLEAEGIDVTFIHCGILSYMEIQEGLMKKFGMTVPLMLYRGKCIKLNNDVEPHAVLFMEE